MPAYLNGKTNAIAHEQRNEEDDGGDETRNVKHRPESLIVIGIVIGTLRFRNHVVFVLSIMPC